MLGRTLPVVPVILLACSFAATAQQVGESINVLPVYKGGTDYCPPESTFPCDALRGDLFGQRQNEPSIAVSTLNKDHVVVFYNDFRAVDMSADQMIPGTASTLARMWNGVKGFFAKVTGRPAPAGTRRGEPELRAAAEAGIGMSVSYDGGLTWTGGFVPGLPFDRTAASLLSPAHAAGLEGMSDPVVMAAPCGRFYLAHLAFTRDGASQMLVSRLQDLNNSDVAHTYQWQGTTLVEQAANASFGRFLDKVHMALALVPNSTSCDSGAITEKVYISYTTFTGNSKTGKFQSKINLASSVDGGKSFTISKVDDSYTQSQGTAVVVNPVNNDVYVFWRSFNAPNTMVMSKTTRTGWSKPLDLLAGDTIKTIATFDQPPVTTDDPLLEAGGLKYELAYRTNGFPTAAITPDGSTVMVAWQERVDSQGRPMTAAGGTPRIVWTWSKNGGAWQPRQAIANNHPASDAGLGFFNLTTNVGPQVMPSLTCGPDNQCLLTYYESRPYGYSGANGLSPVYQWVGGYDRALDLRAVRINAKGTTPAADGTSFQVSRYAYDWQQQPKGPGGEALPVPPATDAETEMAEICPDDNPTHCYPAKNYGGYPHSGGGTQPFMGDYNDVKPVVRYLKDSETAPWRIADKATDAPYGPAFFAAWADNRNLVRPVPADGTEWKNFGNYGPPGKGGSCDNPGSRNQDVMAAQVSLGLLVTAPTNYKPFVAPNIEFPMTVWNNTGDKPGESGIPKKFRLDLTGNGSFSKDENLIQGCVTIYAYSSSSVNVYAWDAQPITVKVTEALADCVSPAASPLTGSITFNSPASAPPAGAAPPYYAPSNIVVNPVTKNPVTKNPVTKNPSPQNPVTKNPVTKNAPVYDVIDYSWTVDPTSTGDYATYLALTSVDKAYQDNYMFQVFVTKPATTFTVDVCDPSNLITGTLVGNVTDPENPVTKNPVTKNPVTKNPVTKNPSPSDIIVQNSSFTLGSSTTTSGGGAGTFAATAIAPPPACDPTTGIGLIGDCTLAAPRRPNQVTITVRAYQLKSLEEIAAGGGKVYDPYGELTGLTPNPPAVIVTEYWCSGLGQGCVFEQHGPDLAAPLSGSVTPPTVPAGATVTFAGVSDITNIGDQPANEHDVKFYISAASKVEDLPRTVYGTIDTASVATYTRQVGTAVDMPKLAPSATESFGPQTLTIPPDIPLVGDKTGTFYLYAYVDSMRVVSELDEDNNIIKAGPITVVAGPDLAAPPSGGMTPSQINAGSSVTFPSPAATIQNVGNREAGPHSVTFYISSASTVAALPRNADGVTINTASATVYTRQLAVLSKGTLAAGSSYGLSQALTIPVDIPRSNADGTGTYYLYAFVDSANVVAELDEANNIILGGPVTVLPPGYGWLALQTPCSGFDCTKTGTLPLAWQFTVGGTPVDSLAARPQMTFFSGCAPDPVSPTPAAISDTPANVTSGNSGWQYFPNPGMTRPQFTWQLNFDSTGLPRGVCYTVYIEVLSTGQILGSTDPKLQPIGPLHIKPM